MTDDLPAPLTPPDCDLRGFDWLPLLGDRLLQSEIWKRGKRQPRSFMVALRLWIVAWCKQVPAASLPDDDDELCDLAGFGEDLRQWAKHKAFALYGFVRCSDGRWYHPLLAAEAIKAHEKRQKHKGKREADADRLRRWRAEQQARRDQTETPDETRFDTRSETPDETHETEDKDSRQDKDKKDSPPTPPPSGGATRRGSPRANGTNPRAGNPTEWKPRNGFLKVIENDLNQLSEAQRADLDEWTQSEYSRISNDQDKGGEQCQRIYIPSVRG